MKKLFKRIGIGLGFSALLIIAGLMGFYLFYYLPAKSMVSDNRALFISMANDFSSCVVLDDPGDCYDQFAHPRLRAVVKRSDFVLFMKNLKSHVGKRVDAELITESFKWNIVPSLNEKTIVVQFSMRANYEKDTNVAENYIFIKDGNEPFLIASSEVRSNFGY